MAFTGGIICGPVQPVSCMTLAQSACFKPPITDPWPLGNSSHFLSWKSIVHKAVCIPHCEMLGCLSRAPVVMAEKNCQTIKPPNKKYLWVWRKGSVWATFLPISPFCSLQQLFAHFTQYLGKSSDEGGFHSVTCSCVAGQPNVLGLLSNKGVHLQQPQISHGERSIN